MMNPCWHVGACIACVCELGFLKTHYFMFMQLCHDYLFSHPFVSCVYGYGSCLLEQMPTWVLTLQYEDPSARPGWSRDL